MRPIASFPTQADDGGGAGQCASLFPSALGGLLLMACLFVAALLPATAQAAAGTIARKVRRTTAARVFAVPGGTANGAGACGILRRGRPRRSQA